MMRRGEFYFHGGCVDGAHGMKGRCLLCGVEYDEENCCGTVAWCPCMALATEWEDISYKNLVLYACYLFGKLNPYNYFWERWYS